MILCVEHILKNSFSAKSKLSKSLQDSLQDKLSKQMNPQVILLSSKEFTTYTHLWK